MIARLATVACAGALVLAFAAERVYVGDADTNLFALDRDDATGALTPLGGSPFTSGSTQNGLVSTADGARLYVSGFQSATISGFGVPPVGGTTLAPLPGSPFSTGAQPTVPALTVDERFFYVPLGSPDIGRLGGYRVDANTGALTARARRSAPTRSRRAPAS